MSMEDKQLVKMFNLTLKIRNTILFFLIVVINGLIQIDSDIGLDMCTKGRQVRKGLHWLQSLANQRLEFP